MLFVTKFLMFIIIWWLVFFVSLPIGVKIDDTPEKGHAESAPSNPKLLTKALITTIVSIILTIIAAYLIEDLFY